MAEYAKRIDTMNHRATLLRDLVNSLSAKNVVSFGGGAPAKEAYPIDIIREISQNIFQKDSRAFEALAYGTAMGLTDLREVVRDILLAPMGVKANLENIMITAGGIQPMNMLCQLFINPGDVILVESPTFVHATMIFEMFEAKCISCTMDDDGLIIPELEEKIKQYHPKIIYTIPTFQNPTGVTLSRERRKQVAELGSKYDIIVLEDDPYREIRYSGESLPPIKAFDQTGNTIFANSFSKIFSPGCRLGYLVASAEIVDKLTDVKTGTDTCTNGISQVLCAEFFKAGHYPKHLENLCNIYRSRRDAMLKAIDAHFPEGTKHTLPDGGYYTWVELPNGLDARALFEAAKSEIQVTYGLGGDFYLEGNGYGNNCLRLSFSGTTEEVISESIAKLGQFFCSKL